MKPLYLLLALGCLIWAGWSVVRFLFLDPGSTGNYAGWKWIVSIILELGLASIFFSLAEEKGK